MKACPRATITSSNRPLATIHMSKIQQQPYKFYYYSEIFIKRRKIEVHRDNYFRQMIGSTKLMSITIMMEKLMIFTRSM